MNTPPARHARLSTNPQAPPALVQNVLDRWHEGNLVFKKLRSASRRSKYRMAVRRTKGFLRSWLPKKYTRRDLVTLYLKNDYNQMLSGVLRRELRFNFNLAIIKPAAYTELDLELRTKRKEKIQEKRMAVRATKEKRAEKARLKQHEEETKQKNATKRKLKRKKALTKKKTQPKPEPKPKKKVVKPKQTTKK